MNEMPKAMDAMSTNPKDGESTQKHFAEVFRQIGIHFINNAERLGNNVVEGTSGVDIFISLEPNSIVSIDISQKELLVRQGLSKNATISKLQVESELTNFLTNINVDKMIDEFAEKLEEAVMEVMDNE